MDVVITDRAKERYKNLNLPDSVIKNIVSGNKGIKFYDKKTKRYIYKYNKLVVVVEHNKSERKVITAFRNNTPGHFGYSNRYVEVF